MIGINVSMMEITISGKDQQLLREIAALAQRLGLKTNLEPKQNGSKLYHLMKQKAESGGVKSIPIMRN